MIEKKLVKIFPHEILATDEVGRGPLSGPVVAGAVSFFFENSKKLNSILKLLSKFNVNDSKKLSALERTKILSQLGILDLPFREVGEIQMDGVQLRYVTWDKDHEIIDLDNILSASLSAMKEAALEISCSKNYPATVLIDGNKKFKWVYEARDWSEIPIIKGDSKSLLIGLASIIAKEKRDLFMKEMHEVYPEYGFDRHFGYPTKEHRNAIEKYGPCPIHRKTFKGVKEFIRR